jgi:hypothetical protein
VIVELRSVPNCPNLEPVRTALHTALAEINLSPTVIERTGDYPSPSVLIDGVDVMGAPDGPAACRLDRPTIDDLRAALRRATSPAGGRATPGDAIRADRADRAGRLGPELRPVHQAILRHFATTGRPPQPADIAQVAGRVGLDPYDALRDLAADDLVATDGTGALVAAYPFSPVPTTHAVTVGDVRTFAMCAIDALGIPYMLDADATVSSVDPQTGQPVVVTVAAGAPAFAPPEAVVVYATTGDRGRSVDTCCSTINFFASAGTALTWLTARPHLAATVLDQDEAVRLAREIFEPLLRDGPRAPA